MNNEEILRSVGNLFADPLFKRDFFDFLLIMQREGVEAAKRSCNFSPVSKAILPNALEIYEKLVDFYIIFGFVPCNKYDQALRDNEQLRQENKFLKDTIREMQFNIFQQGGEMMQETCREITGRQLEMHQEMGKNFLEFFRQLQEGGR